MNGTGAFVFGAALLLVSAQGSSRSLRKKGNQIQRLEGKIRVVGSSGNPSVLLRSDSDEQKLFGTLTVELQRLASFQVRVIGRQKAGDFIVRDYSILDIGNGGKPLIGMLLKNDEGSFALRDGDEGALALNLRPSSKQRLSRYNGSKIWVWGERLASGEYRVKRYGIIREAQRAKPVAEQPPEEN